MRVISECGRLSRLNGGRCLASSKKDSDEEIIKKRIVVDNSHYGFWDFEILANEFDVDLLLAKLVLQC